jgi:hypothetical protein
MRLKEELLKEMYQSIHCVNKLFMNDELTQETKEKLIEEEVHNQENLTKFSEEWNR